jgi:hypothetical protein
MRFMNVSLGVTVSGPLVSTNAAAIPFSKDFQAVDEPTALDRMQVPVSNNSALQS